MKKRKIKEQGITLIALVVTIVVLLILAGVSIGALNGDSGLVNQALDAESGTETEHEKEILGIAIRNAIAKDGLGNVTKEKLKVELDKIIGENEYELSGEETLTVKFKETGRKYNINKSGEIQEVE